MRTLNEATLNLFNGILVDEKSSNPYSTDILVRGIKNGYILQPSIAINGGVLNTIESIVGISGLKANRTFHKSWDVVRDTSMEQLVIQQLVHYITTYGFEAFGIFSHDTVYIPHEVLTLPELSERIPLTVIKAMSLAELFDGIVKLASGVALSQETLNNIKVLIENCNFDYLRLISAVKNRELKSFLYDFYGAVPSDPVEYLRYLINKLTGETLVIKNKELINKIKESDGKLLDLLLTKAPPLSSIFLRYKPLFLAMKSISNNKTYFNNLRRLSVHTHKPIGEDYLNTVTGQIRNGNTLSLSELANKLPQYNVFRKIRLAYALSYRLNPAGSIVYQVRNGRGWAESFSWSPTDRVTTTKALRLVLANISNDIFDKVVGKIIYIPNSIHYALPATEKQFSGNIPTNSYVTVSTEDMLVGIHWTDVNNSRVDLDLSMVGTSKMGWDGGWRTDGRERLFSGDVTSAPKPDGASEFFYIKNAPSEPASVYVNDYTRGRYDDKGDEIPTCKLIIASEKPNKSNFVKNYMVDINNIVASANITLTEIQTNLGLVVNVGGENRFYFSNVGIGKGITSRASGVTEKAKEFAMAKTLNSINLKDVLEMAGALIFAEKPTSRDYIDLSPEALNKTTILDLFL
jgi:hypothetical protein